MNRNVIRCAVLFTVVVLALATSAEAYSYTANDFTDYDWGDGWYSIYCFTDVHAYEDTGEVTCRGSNPWWALHTCTLVMGMHFTATSTGRAYCSAEISLSYKLIAGTAKGAYSLLNIYLSLYNSAHTAELDSVCIFADDAVCTTGGQYDETSGTDYVDEYVQWDYTLQSGSTYYAVVKVYLRTFNGGYVYSSTGTRQSPTTMSADVAEISVYT
jgi:hypothetical protein